MDQNLIKESAKLITILRNVYFIGVGISGITVTEAHDKFFRLTQKFHCLTDSHFQLMTAQIMTEEDLLVVFSLSGSTKEIVDAVKEAKKNGCRVISITNFNKSPITKIPISYCLASIKGIHYGAAHSLRRFLSCIFIDFFFIGVYLLTSFS